MLKHHNSAANGLVSYELSADDFELYEGDTIAPGCEIGIDARSGAAVCLDHWVRVSTAYYHPMNDSYLVMIQRLSEDRQFAGAQKNGFLITA